MDFETAKSKAIKYLGISRKTEHEVRDKLYRLNVEEETIDKVIDYLKGLDYINDNQYVDAYIRQCMRLLDYSKYEIKQKLLQKGINKNIIDERVDMINETDYEKKLTEKLLNTKCKNMDDLKKKQYLYRRGLRMTDD